VRTDRPRLAIVHDYLTQRGGAERVVGVVASAFPGAPIYTSLYEPSATFEEFATLDVRPGVLNHVGYLRHHHRAALPVLAPWFSTRHIDADVVLASSSGWAHEVRTDGRLVVYCHAPARWLYQADRYLRATDGAPRGLAAAGLRILGPALRAADRRAARRASSYLANSTSTATMVRELYGIDAEVLCPPPALSVDGPATPLALDEGFVLCVSRLLAYKHVDLLVDAAARLEVAPLGSLADHDEPPVREPRGGVDEQVDGPATPLALDATLRWCYRSAAVLVALGYEDFGLAPLEAASFGVATVARRFGGFLDTVVDGTTGTLLDGPTAATVADAIEATAAAPPSRTDLERHAAAFSTERFVERIAEVLSPG
jgi:glycosyltransferase involved in cell wall biosynthesis